MPHPKKRYQQLRILLEAKLHLRALSTRQHQLSISGLKAFARFLKRWLLQLSR